MVMEGGSYYDSDLLQESADEVVDRIPECHLCVMELKNADPKQQQEAADKLRSQVDATARQLSTEQFGKWEAEVHARVFNLLNGEELTDKLGAIAAVAALVGTASTHDEATKRAFSGHLQSALYNNTQYVLLEKIAQALGLMVKNSVSSTSDFTEGQISNALTWLEEEAWHRRLGACLVLRELAKQAGNSLFTQMTEVLQSIVRIVHDPRLDIREAAADALTLCLEMLAKRREMKRPPGRSYLDWLQTVFGQVEVGLSSKSEPEAHGSILMACALLNHGGSYMIDRLTQTCEHVMILKDSDSPMVRKSVITLLPQLAKYAPRKFGKKFLPETLKYLYEVCRSGSDECPGAFQALGRLCVAMMDGDRLLMSEVETLLTLVLVGLGKFKPGVTVPIGTREKKLPFYPEALECLANVTKALKQAVSPFVEELLEPLFSHGLSRQMIDTLTVLSNVLPVHRYRIQERLLLEISILLTGKKHEPPGTTPPWLQQGGKEAAAAARYGKGADMLVGVGGEGVPNARVSIDRSTPREPVKRHFLNLGRRDNPPDAEEQTRLDAEEQLRILALETLGSFKLTAFVLLAFVKDVVLQFLVDPSVEVRKQATLTCCEVLAKHGKQILQRGATGRVTEVVLLKLLQVAISDSSAGVRHTLLRALDGRFDRCLCQPHHLQTLCLLMGDFDFPIQLDALSLLGRLATVNPAYLLPQMRQTLIQILTELKFDQGVKAQQCVTRRLCAFLRCQALQGLVHPYVKAIIVALPLKARSANEEEQKLATLGLEALGDLSLCASELMNPYMGELIPFIITSMQDSTSSTRREVSLCTLGRMIGATRYVVKPYMCYPTLMDSAFAILRAVDSSIPWSLRREVLRTLGILGALDPYKYQQIQLHLREERLQKESLAVSTGGGNDAPGATSDGSRATAGVRGAGGGTAAGGAGAQMGGRIMASLGGGTDGNEGAVAVAAAARTAAEAAANAGSLSGGTGPGGKGGGALGGDLMGRVSARSAFTNSNNNGLLQDDDVVPPALALMDQIHDGAQLAHAVLWEQSFCSAQPNPPAQPDKLTVMSAMYNEDVCIRALMAILRDPSLNAHHSMVTQAVMKIFEILGLKSVPFLESILPTVLIVVRRCEAGLRSSLLRQMQQLIHLLKMAMVPYLPKILDLLEKCWTEHPEQVVPLLEEVAQSVPDFFRLNVDRALPLLLASLAYPRVLEQRALRIAAAEAKAQLEAKNNSIASPPKQPPIYRDERKADDRLVLVLSSLVRMKSMLEHHLVVVLPALIKLVEKMADEGPGKGGLLWHRQCIITVYGVVTDPWSLVRYPDLAARLVHALVRLLATGGNVVTNDANKRSGGALRFVSLVTAGAPVWNANDEPPRTGKGKDVLLKSLDDQRADSIYGMAMEVLSCVAAQLGRRFLMFESMAETYLEEARAEEQAQRYRHLARYVKQQADMANRQGRPDFSHLPSSQSSHSRPIGNGRGRGVENLPPGGEESAKLWRMRGEYGTVYGSSGTHSVEFHTGSGGGSGAGGGGGAGGQLRDGSNGTDENNQFPEMNQHNLEKAWTVLQVTTKEDWEEWIRRFSLELLREAPSGALRACAPLAQAYQPLSTKLLHASFVCCWLNLNESMQFGLVSALKVVLTSDNVPPDILQTLLNLAEFMEHEVEGETLPIDIRMLAHLAERCHAYAKALHYKELEFVTDPLKCIESLVHINKKLGQPEAAQGILTHAEKKFVTVDVKEDWLSKLGRWEDALVQYSKRREENPTDFEAILGCMKCLDAMGEWDKLVEMCKHDWDYIKKKPSVTTKAASLAARATWSLGKWDKFAGYVAHTEEEVVEGSYLRAVMALKNDDFVGCTKYVDKARELLDKTFTTLVGESYKRAYQNMVMVQQLAELEEMVNVKQTMATLKERGGGAGTGQSSAKVNEAIDGQTEKLLKLLKAKWKLRLQGCAPEVSVYQSILTLRGLVLTPEQDIHAWLNFASLCRITKNFRIARKVLTAPLGLASAPRNVEERTEGSSRSLDLNTVSSRSEKVTNLLRFAYIKHRKAEGNMSDALDELSLLARTLCEEETALKVKCLLKMGNWELSRVAPTEPLSDDMRDRIFSAYQMATQLEPENYKAWHSWAMVNFRTVEFIMQGANSSNSAAGLSDTGGIGSLGPATGLRRSRSTGIIGGRGMLRYGPGHSHGRIPETEQTRFKACLVAAAKAFIKAIMLGKKKWSALVQQDLLNLLTIWFRHGVIHEVSQVLNDKREGIHSVNLDYWLGVVPQLIACMNHQNALCRKTLHDLLMRLGQRHPQALVNPLSVARKSPKQDRREAAKKLMNDMEQHSSGLVQQAMLVSDELIRVAILWHEQWHEGLEDASRLYHGDNDVNAMLEIVTPLHEALEDGPVTEKEEQFQKTFGEDLTQAWEYIKKFRERSRAANRLGGNPQSGDGSEASKMIDEAFNLLNRAWDLYYGVFRKINKQLPQMSVLDLKSVSPKLLKAQDLSLCIPGTYRVDGSCVKIHKFLTHLQVIPSKQRPRKITMKGEDGRDYVFLLKGHEDLRQDERVMQLFGQVNALLAKDRRNYSHDLSIQRYAVAPLSHNAGVVGWVPNTDTLHQLIRDYRESRQILLNIEHRLMTQSAAPCEYDSLSVMQKVEVFEAALKHTAGQDLYKVLWLKSQNSEAWLERRTCYTRSLAVMSMVGYILGLGDRHPSNLMLDRFTGKILHIDFGDCFEVAMNRGKFPEKIPFRLTRMLVNAMEVSGIEGNFRTTCELVMSVLRESRDSLIAMLEAFVHDPLVSWKLLGTNNCQPSQQAGSDGTATNANNPLRANTEASAPFPPAVHQPPPPSHPSARPTNMELIPVTPHVSSPVPIPREAKLAGPAGQGAVGTNSTVDPQQAPPPPTPRLGPMKCRQRVTGWHGNWSGAASAAPGAAAAANDGSSGYNLGVPPAVGAAVSGGVGEAGLNAGPAAVGAPGGGRGAGGGGGGSVRYNEGGGHGYAPRVGSATGGVGGGGSGGSGHAPPIVRVPGGGSSIPRPSMRPCMMPLQPVPEFDRGWSRDSDGEVEGEESSTPPPTLPQVMTAAAAVTVDPLVPQFNAPPLHQQEEPVVPESNALRQEQLQVRQFSAPQHAKPLVPQFSAPLQHEPLVPQFNAQPELVLDQPLVPEFNENIVRHEHVPLVPQFNEQPRPRRDKPLVPQFDTQHGPQEGAPQVAMVTGPSGYDQYGGHHNQQTRTHNEQMSAGGNDLTGENGADNNMPLQPLQHQHQHHQHQHHQHQHHQHHHHHPRSGIRVRVSASDGRDRGVVESKGVAQEPVGQQGNGVLRTGTVEGNVRSRSLAPASASVNIQHQRTPSMSIGEPKDTGGDRDDHEGQLNEEEEERLVAAAAAAAAEAAGVNRPAGQENSYIQMSSSFRPNMHLQMQALSARHNRSAAMTGMDGRGDDDIGATVNCIANARFSRSTRERDLVLAHGAEGSSAPQEAVNAKAVEVIRRVQDKLAGLDFGNKMPYDVDEQVDRLIRAAQSNEKLCQCFIGWCPFW